MCVGGRRLGHCRRGYTSLTASLAHALKAAGIIASCKARALPCTSIDPPTGPMLVHRATMHVTIYILYYIYIIMI